MDIDNYIGTCILFDANAIFKYDDGVLEISQIDSIGISNLRNIVNSNGIYIEKINGITFDRKPICFINNTISFNFKNHNLLSRPAGFIIFENRGQDMTIDAIDFTGQIVNRFYPQHLSASIDNLFNPDGDIKISFKSFSERTVKVEPKSDKIDFVFTLSTSNPSIGLGYSDHFIGDVRSIARLEFQHPLNYIESTIYFARMLRLFWFLNNRKNIQFDKVYLKSNEAENGMKRQYVNVGTLHLDYTYENSATNIDHHSIEHRDISGHFPALISSAFSSSFLTEYIREKKSPFQALEKHELLAAAASFESIYEKLTTGKLSKTNPTFRKIKMEMYKSLDGIKKEIGSDNVHLVNKIKDAIRHQENTLREKYEAALVQYDSVISAEIDKLFSYFDYKRDYLSVIDYFKKTRDKLSHGHFEEINIQSFLCYHIVVRLIYIIQLDMLGMTSDEIKVILEKLTW